jgi:hypothetical protein
VDGTTEHLFISIKYLHHKTRRDNLYNLFIISARASNRFRRFHAKQQRETAECTQGGTQSFFENRRPESEVLQSLEALKKGNTGGGAAVDDRTGETVTGSDTNKALTMLEAFARVGATAFDVTLTNLDGEKTLFQPRGSLDELQRTITRRLEAAVSLKQNIIIHPRSATAALIQLDDLNHTQAEQIAPQAFLVICTSSGNQSGLGCRDGCTEREGRRPRLCPATAQGRQRGPDRHGSHAPSLEPQLQNEVCTGLPVR